jgi:hypothetical protein
LSAGRGRRPNRKSPAFRSMTPSRSDTRTK